MSCFYKGIHPPSPLVTTAGEEDRKRKGGEAYDVDGNQTFGRDKKCSIYSVKI